jgi:hypothetical protein
MVRARLLLGKVPAVWRDTLMELVDSDEGVDIVGEVDESVDLLLQVRVLRANGVVLCRLPDGDEPGICSHLLLEYPNLEILLLPTSSETGALCTMVLRKELLQDASKESIRIALRRLGHARAGTEPV